MPQWMQDLVSGWPMIRANPPTFFVILALMIGAIWLVMNYVYGERIANRDGIIGNRDSEIAMLKGQRDDYRDKLSGATPDQAKARIDVLETRLARLEPRRLTDTQQTDLTARLRLPAGIIYSVAVMRDMACGECTQLTADITASFSHAGWNTSNPMAMGIGNAPPHGIAVRCADIANPSPDARLIIDAMRGIGLQFDLQPNGYRPSPPPGLGPPLPSVEILITTRVMN